MGRASVFGSLNLFFRSPEDLSKEMEADQARAIDRKGIMNNLKKSTWRVAIASAAAGAFLLMPAFVPGAAAASSKQAPVTPATDIHGAPGNTPGFGGSSANPNGEGNNGGNGIHMIANGAPGQGGEHPTDGGDPPGCDMHGGLNNYNANCD
jgi:hypothetical protein